MTTITRMLLLATILFFFNSIHAQTRFYVSAAATGAGDGSSWTNAFTDLQDALVASQYGDEIWVAKGTYYPTTTTDRNISFELKNGVKLYGGFAATETQLGQRDWVANETVLSGDIGVVGDSLDNAYNVVYMAYVDSTTILDGVVVTRGRTSNSTQYSGLDRRKSGGGLYIQATSATTEVNPKIVNCIFVKNFGNIRGGGVFVNGSNGGSISPAFTSCVFQENKIGTITEAGGGAGLAIIGGSFNADLNLTGCKFNQNISLGGGGGVDILWLHGTKDIYFQECIYNDCSSISSGGGVNVDDLNITGGKKVFFNTCNFENNYSNALSYSGSTAEIFIKGSNFNNNSGQEGNITVIGRSSIYFSNSTFQNNQSSNGCFFLLGGNLFATNSLFIDNKGDLFTILAYTDVLNASISNCTFHNNKKLLGEPYNGLIHMDGSGFGANLEIGNSIFNGNQINGPGKLFRIVDTDATIDNSLLDIASCAGIATAPITCGPNMIYNLAPQFVDPDNGNFHLLPTSPAINAGDNAIVNSLGILTDLDGNTRIQGGTVDMGAYESDSGSNNAGVKYVNTNVQGGNNDGTSWANAYHDLQDALAASQYGDEIWVAKGTYYPTTTTDRNISFELKNGVKLYGGFAGAEAQLSERDWVVNETVLSGDIGVLVDSLDNSYTVIFLSTSDSLTLLDGITIKAGNANGLFEMGNTDLQNSGGGMYIDAKSSYAYPVISNCTFINNNAAGNGGGVCVDGRPNGSIAPQFKDCKFINNKAGKFGGGVYKAGGSIIEVGNDFLNCFFDKNNAHDAGGGVFYLDSERSDRLEFSKCLFVENEGGGIAFFGGRENIGSRLKVDSCAFKDNFTFDFYSIPIFFETDLIDKFEFTNCSFYKEKFGHSESISIIGFSENNSFVSIENCNFSNNSSIKPLAISFEILSANLNIKNCFFSKLGGVLRSSYANKIFISNSKFIENSSDFSIQTIDTTLINNCFFQKNKLILTENSFSEFFRFTNSTFVQNGDSTFSYFPNTKIDFYNCIFHDNIAAMPVVNPITFETETLIINHQVPFANHFPHLYYSIVDTNSCVNSLPSPITCGPGMLYDLDPLFRDTAAGDYLLLPCSPARNAGSNTIVDSLGILTDIEGNPRIQGGTVDMGAYESPAFQAANAAVTAQACGGGTGTVSLTLENGCPPFFLDWGADSSISDTTVTSLDLPIGTHSVTVTDGRMEADTVSVSITAAPAITATAVAFPVNCATGTGGMASVETIGGTGNFGFHWSNGGTTASINNLPSGSYQVTVTDASGCTATASATVGLTGNLALGINIHPITCPGDSDGSAIVQPIGGLAPFTWLWQDGQSTATIENLSGGNYAATVTDALGCTGDIDFTISPPQTIGISIATVEPLCFGETGTATASATGGTGNFSFQWDNGATTANTMLGDGTHIVTATDANGCMATATTTVTAPPLLVFTLDFEPQMLCHGASNGSFTINPTGGTPPYSWVGQTENISAGNYAFTVTDANGCSKVKAIVVSDNPAIAVGSTAFPASSPTAADGSVHINSVTGGTGNGYTFLWSNGSTEQNLTGVPTGDYALTVTDSQGCTGVFSFHVDFNSAAGEQFQNAFGAAIVPNPSGSGGARLILDRPIFGLSIRVFDAKGNLVFAKRNDSTEYALPKGLPAGTYRVFLESDSGKTTLTWVVGE